ncbi:probable cysteine desulfurase [Macadamia integrifolia]|uniref:probable cysteine desulfurase n=1 Tax=Macadamia integrifolia TaxID=60698 RepID=UPI001C4F8C91|nr:probable cysteine desulfurase [Macadamia integrifolia]
MTLHLSLPSLSSIQNISTGSGQISEPTKSNVPPETDERHKKADDFNLFDSLTIGPETKGLLDDTRRSKCEWLRSQIIGTDAKFSTPFGRRRITYADHTASGRFLQFVEEFLQREVLPFYGNTHTVDSFVGLHTGNLIHDACGYIKKCMGAGPHDVLLFPGTGTTAAIKRLQEVMGIAIPSVLRSKVIDCLVGSERWVVFTGPYEHHSNLLSWRQSLADVVEIGIDENGNVDINSLVKELESPEFSGRPKLGSFSACSNVTGIYANTRAIARVLHEHGAYACFDFACSGPYVDIDMRSEQMDGYDAVFLSPHKFIGGPGSPGILVMSEDLYLLKAHAPSTSGGGTVRYVNGYDAKDTIYCENLEEREDAGTPGIVQKIRAALAFRVKEEFMGYDGLICSMEAFLIERALDSLLKNPNVKVLGNKCTPGQPIVSFLIYPDSGRGKHLHCRFVTKLLNDLFGIQARGGCACAGPYAHLLLGISRDRAGPIRSAVEKGYEGVKPGWTRVSFSYYTSVEEMEYIIDSIEFIAEFGHRFLRMYQFDWKTGDWCFNNYYRNVINGVSTKSNANNVTFNELYAEYMDIAKRVVRALPDHPVETLQIPEFIDTKLVTFMI